LVQRVQQARAEEARMTEIMTAISREISLGAILAKISSAGCQQALAERPEDGPSSFYIDRCKFYMANPPPEYWDGVWTDRRK
jgi:hypothetical protein